jgi:hypothetical protein
VLYESAILPKHAKARKKRARLLAQYGTSKSPVFRAKFFGENGNSYLGGANSMVAEFRKTERF